MKKLILIFLLLIPFEIFCSTRVAFVGDSITYGYGVKEQQRYSNITQELLKKYGKDIEVINKGVNGQGSDNAIKVVDHLIAFEKPDIVVIGSGICDAAYKYPEEKIRENFEKMISTLLDNKIKVIVGVVEPNYIIPAYEKIFNDLYPYLKSKYSITLFMLLSTHILQEKVSDNVHPNPEGHKEIAEKLTEALLTVID